MEHQRLVTVERQRLGRVVDDQRRVQACAAAGSSLAITVRPAVPGEHDRATTAEFIEPYRQRRPMVERSIAWLVRRGGRKARSRGIARREPPSST